MSASLARVQLVWAEKLSVPIEALTSAGTQSFVRPSATAVVVVALAEACVVLGPPHATRRLQGLEVPALLDAGLLLSRLEAFAPTPIGTASLSYLEANPVTRPVIRAVPADPSMMATLQGRVSTDEWDESGLAGMTHRWAVLAQDGEPAALAGYERWGADLAQMGVVADPSERGRGHASAAVLAALTAATDEGLVAQWRCRVGNTASERLATRLGFTRVGFQVAVTLS
ncbi:GNAT family N-acetyltransferase [Nocardioides sp.]|uniref:GNAT family N-acetyltransferase n=1 Tax=Nocardioides sp. TaxID=35761 RepID=UPI002732365B|nr:GNAT family protein [Nocardioides sp.]MDP3890749.1 GNAT family protein [Nocardioides sp.]